MRENNVNIRRTCLAGGPTPLLLPSPTSCISQGLEGGMIRRVAGEKPIDLISDQWEDRHEKVGCSCRCVDARAGCLRRQPIRQEAGPA
jgi:hypothetical protein